jgi:hypothetical protein
MSNYFRDLLRLLPGMLGAIFIGVTATLFLVFPRVVNWLADQFGNMGDPLEVGQALIHWAVALFINLVLIYFFVFRPLQRLRQARRAQGLIVRRGQGVAFMDAESARQQVYGAVSALPAVQRVEVTVGNNQGRAEVQLNVLVDREVNAAKKKQEIRREIKKIVEDQLGVALAGEPVINIRLTSLGADIPYAVTPEAPYTPPPARPAPPPPVVMPTASPEAVREPAPPGDVVRGWRRDAVPESIKGYTNMQNALAPSGELPVPEAPIEFGAAEAAPETPKAPVTPSLPAEPEPGDRVGEA